MKLPQHENPRSDREALAPYNFVPLPEKVLRAEAGDLDAFSAGRHTGYFECDLTTETPLYVRCGLLPGQTTEGRERPDFFFTDPDNPEPVVPGSSLRGMLRGLVEIISYSKVQPVTPQALIYRAVGDTSSLGERYRERLLTEIGSRKYEFRMHAGYMQWHGRQWEIVPAQPLNGAAFARVEKADVDRHKPHLPHWRSAQNAWEAYVALDPLRDYAHNRGRVTLRYVKATQVSPTPAHGLLKAVIVCTGWMGRKHQEFVFGLPDTRPGQAIPVDSALIDAYKEQLTDEQKKLLGRNGVLQDGQPVFYLMEKGKLIFFGHAMMMRLPYLNSPNDFVPAALRNPEITDLAEALFGYVEEHASSRDVARAGRVCVTDARLESGQSEIWLSQDPITPKILATPKPTTFQHYLVQTAPNDKKSLQHYASSTPEGTVIRGHKLYWHKRDLQRSDWEERNPVAPNDKQHTHIQPVRPGVRFQFRIYFDDLDDRELGALVWLLDIAAAEEYRFKLGMGKPLGLGSVRIMPTLHLTDRITRYTELFEAGNWAAGEIPAAEISAQAQQAFEQAILSDRELNPTGAERLDAVDRIKMLLMLLQWSGPAKEKTRYLEIEHGPAKENEYKERPVLPTPAGVLQPQRPGSTSSNITPGRSGTTAPMTTRGTGAATAAPISRAPVADRTPPPPPASAPVIHPTSLDDIKPGVIIEGDVIKVETDRVLLDLGLGDVYASMGIDKLDGLVRSDATFEEYWELGRSRLNARFLQQEGALEIALRKAKLQVKVLRIDQKQGKRLVKVDFVAWPKD